MKQALSIFSLFFLLGLAPPPSRATEEIAPPVINAMTTELKRAQSRLRLKGYEAPYFIAYTVRDYHQREIAARFGALTMLVDTRSRQAHAEVRVGDYQLDNSSSNHDLSIDLDDGEPGWEPPTETALDDDPEVLRTTLWLLTDARYKAALASYAKKRGQRATMMVEDESLPSFSRDQPNRHFEVAAKPLDTNTVLADRARRLSARFKDHSEILDGTVKFSVEQDTRNYVNTEGSAIASDRVIYAVELSATVRAKDGMLLDHQKDFYGRAPSDLPDEAALAKAEEQLVGELLLLREAPKIDPYTGPAILMEEAAGVFFHETVGHRLEGERQNDEKEGRTFKGQLGHLVLPEFLSIVDDPTAARAGGVALNGTYAFDDEAVAARAVTLVQNGVLRDYIKSRTPITGSLHSNGHGRSEGTADPMGRMGNLFIRSSKQVPLPELKQMLLAEVRKQGKPYGLIIRDITGGSTNTISAGFQAFKGLPRLVYRVDAKTGAETLVRGVEMVGTPLTTVSRIVATSNTVGVFNGYCGAESGFVPVSTVAPAVLMSEIELQRTARAMERPPILPPPWTKTH